MYFLLTREKDCQYCLCIDVCVRPGEKDEEQLS